jgi:hypothetical protein
MEKAVVAFFIFADHEIFAFSGNSIAATAKEMIFDQSTLVIANKAAGAGFKDSVLEIFH